MNRRALFLFAAILGGWAATGVHAATHTAASCNLSDVQAAITTAITGDTVVIPAGTCSWTSGLSLSKGIHLKGVSKGAVTLTYNAGASATLISVTENATRSIEISNLRFTVGSGGTEAWHGMYINVNGGGKAVLVHDNYFEIPGRRSIHWSSNKGVIWNNEFYDPTHSPVGSAIVVALNGSDSWSRPDTMGTRDTTGESNVYIEDNTFREVTTQVLDPDSFSRVVIRYNLFDQSGMASHGAETSADGTRHWEIYNNTFTFINRGDCSGDLTLGVPWFYYIRGGTGIIADNKWADITSCAWGNKSEMNMTIQNLRRNVGPYACWKTYPAPRQIGQSHNGTSYFTDPVYIWGNSGGGSSTPGLSDYSPNECGTGAPAVSQFIQAGRDFVVGTKKPDYTKYVYPHPLRGGSVPPPTDTTPPSAPTGLTAIAASGTQINLSWTASTDNIGVTGYQVERCSGATCTTFAQVATPAGTSYSNTGLTAATTYRFRVRAVDAEENLSGYSAIMSATTTSGQTGGPPSLPQGNAGVAAAFPNDANIQFNASVLFADGFETYTSASQLTGSGNYSSYYQGANIAFDTATFFGGTKAVRVRMPATGSEVSNAIVKRVSPEQDRLFMRVYMRFQPNYGGIVDAHNGLRITGRYPGPGTRPSGSNFFLVTIENSRYKSEGEPGYSHAYVYHPEQDDLYGEHWYSDGTVGNGTQNFGQYFVARPNVLPARGVWLCYEVMIQLNTPGTRDGRVAVWQDGALIADWQNLRFRDVSTVKIDEIQLENGGKSSSQINDKWYDNLVLGTSYIGPMVTGQTSNTPPAAPRGVRFQ
jgi:chitodextrinase